MSVRMKCRGGRPGAIAMWLAAALLCAAAVESGCYRRVVGARGLGADQYEVAEPYQSEGGWIDRKVFGTGTDKRSGSRLE